MGQNLYQPVFHPKSDKKDDKKSEPGKVFRETLEVLLAGLVFVLMLIGASVVLQALCRCR